MKEANEMKKRSRSRGPKPSFVFSTTTMGPNDTSPRRLYVNVLCHPKCPGLKKRDGKTDAKPDAALSEIMVPLSVGELCKHRDSRGPFNYVDVVFNPKVTERGEKDVSFKFYLIELSLTHIDEDHKIVSSRGYKNEAKIAYKGKKEQPLAPQPPTKQPGAKRSGKGAKRATRPAAGPTPDIVMPKAFASALGTQADGETAPLQPKTSGGKSSAKETKRKGPLIVDITKESAPAPPEPKVEVKLGPDGRTPASVVVKLRLPKAESAADINADVSSAQVTVTGLGYNIVVPFPHTIDDASATAKFSKRKRQLKISAPVLPRT